MRLNQDIIEKYLLNNCTKAEKILLEACYKSFDKNPDGITDLNEEDLLALKTKVRANIEERIKPSLKIVPPQWVWFAASIAAMFLIVFSLSFYIDSENKINNSKTVLSISEWVKYENSSAKILKVILPDSSTIWLQPKTSLSYNQADRLLRQVNLIGEAFFDVKRDMARPFLIYSGKMTTKVLGTSFNVKAFPNNNQFEVAVVTGKVAVYNEADKEVLLLPKQKVIHESKSDNLTIKNLAANENNYWEPTSLQFDDSAIQSVVEKLENNFNITIQVNNLMQNCRLSGNFEMEHLATILEVICKATNAEYTIDGKQVLIKGQGCN